MQGEVTWIIWVSQAVSLIMLQASVLTISDQYLLNKKQGNKQHGMALNLRYFKYYVHFKKLKNGLMFNQNINFLFFILTWNISQIFPNVNNILFNSSLKKKKLEREMVDTFLHLIAAHMLRVQE